jgi:formyl-CoA transferase
MPRTLANPIRLGFAEQQIAKPAPALGQHSEQILAEAGLSRDEIASLRASGAIR